jgi:hypothetical protein
MVQPINYMQDVQTPFQAAAQGLTFGAGIQQMQAQQQEQQLKIQAAQAAQEQQQAMRERIQDVMSNPNPTAKDYAQLSMLMPKDQAESTRKAWDMLSADRQQAQLGRAGQVLAAFNSGANDIAQGLLKDEATALRNAGDEAGAKAAEVYAQIAEINPAMARTNIGLLLAGIPGGDKVIEGITKLGTERRAEEKAPFELSEAQSDAKKAAVAAKFAESDAVLEQQKKGWDITKLQEDIKINKMNAQIAAANAATNREGNTLKRQELGLKLQEMKDKRDTLVREKVAEVETARGDMDNFTNTVDRFLAAAVDKDGKPSSTIRAAAGPLDQMTPTFQPDVADLEALVETIGSQAFMAQIPKMKGTGALSEGEGKKLQASLQNFSLKQSPERLIENMKEAQRLIQKGRSNLAKKYGVPDTVPDTPHASTGAGDINALLLKYGAK